VLDFANLSSVLLWLPCSGASSGVLYIIALFESRRTRHSLFKSPRHSRGFTVSNYKTFIFVQYKRLREENNNHIYRANNDKSLIKEIERMNNLKVHMMEDKYDYRINNEIFYFKFCKEKQDIYTKDLCQGFYLPKDFFELIYNKQKKGNKSIVFSYDVVGRYLNNTLFIELIKSGLIGSKNPFIPPK
jgi:hypothetical protein